MRMEDVSRIEDVSRMAYPAFAQLFNPKSDRIEPLAVAGFLEIFEEVGRAGFDEIVEMLARAKTDFDPLVEIHEIGVEPQNIMFGGGVDGNRVPAGDPRFEIQRIGNNALAGDAANEKSRRDLLGGDPVEAIVARPRDLRADLFRIGGAFQTPHPCEDIVDFRRIVLVTAAGIFTDNHVVAAVHHIGEIVPMRAARVTIEFTVNDIERDAGR